MCFVRGIKIRQRRRMRTVINSKLSGRKHLSVKSLFTRDIGVGRSSVLIISYLTNHVKHTRSCTLSWDADSQYNVTGNPLEASLRGPPPPGAVGSQGYCDGSGWGVGRVVAAGPFWDGTSAMGSWEDPDDSSVGLGLGSHRAPHPHSRYNGALMSGLGTRTTLGLREKFEIWHHVPRQCARKYAKLVNEKYSVFMCREVCTHCINIMSSRWARHERVTAGVIEHVMRGGAHADQMLFLEQCFSRMCRMSDDGRYAECDRLYFGVLRGASMECKGCRKDGKLRSHLYGSLVKCVCPADYCEALIPDRPDAVQEHWELCHRELGERPRALHVVLPKPRCKVRWRRYPGQRERQVGRAKVMSIAPAQTEWEESKECQKYPLDTRQRNYNEGVVTLDPVYALPKRQVSTFVSFVPVVMWRAQPDLPTEVERWIWKSIGAKIPPSHLRINYASSGESEVEGSKRHPDQQVQVVKPAKPKTKKRAAKKVKLTQPSGAAVGQETVASKSPLFFTCDLPVDK